MRPNIFQKALDDDENETFTNTRGSHSHINHMYDRLKNQTAQKMVQSTTKALLEDTSNTDIFGYDSYYDAIQLKKKEIQFLKQKDKGEARYQNSLLDAAEKRKRERSIVYEKMAEKELEKDKNKTSERFITESYKEVLELNKKFLKEDEEKEEYNQNNSVNNKTDLNELYRTLYKENMFAGGDRLDIADIAKKNMALKKKQEEIVKNQEETLKKLKTNNEKEIFEKKEGKTNANLEKKPEILIKRSRSRSTERKSPKTKEEKLKSARDRYLERKNIT